MCTGTSISKICWSHDPTNQQESTIDMADLQIKYCDVPSYLHAGEFYRNLDSDDPDGIIEIPADCFHPDGETAADLEEFRRLLRVMGFWALDDILVGVLEFCKENEVDVWEKSLVELPDDVVAEVQPLLLTAYSNHDIVPLYDVIKTGRLDLIMHAVARIDKSGSATVPVALCGDLGLLKYLHEQGYGLSEDTCAAASQNGHLDCLQYARGNGCPWNVSIYLLAAGNGHLSCMQYAFEQGLEWDAEVCPYASGNGCFDCLQFAHENGCPWDGEVSIQAAVGGHLSCMQYAFERGLEWHADVCRVAALYGHLDCLQFAHENGCPWDNQTTDCAAQEGHIHCLQYALDGGCPVDENACALACRHSHLDCVQLLHQFGAPWTAEAPIRAAERSDTACLIYLHENGCPWDADTCKHAAYWGHVEPLRYAVEHGCPHSHDIVQSAACSNNLDCLQYVVEEQALYMDQIVFNVALLRGDLACLQYLLDQGCPYVGAELPSDVERWTVMDGFFRKDNPEFMECVEYAVERGWTPGEYFVQYIVPRDEPCRDWLQKEGYYIIDDMIPSEMNDSSLHVVDSTPVPQESGCALM